MGFKIGDVLSHSKHWIKEFEEKKRLVWHLKKRGKST
jgi:hypothetical protein